MKWIARIGQDRNFRGGRNHFPAVFLSLCRRTRVRWPQDPLCCRPGCDMLWTRPSLSGWDATNTIGMLAVADFRATAACVLGARSTSGLRADQLGGESWQAILGGGIAILDDQVSSIDPAVVSQPVNPRFLNGRLHHIHGEKATRRRVPCASERRGETSSAALAAMNSRRFIRSSRCLRTTGRRVSRLDCGRTHSGANAASQMPCVVQDGDGSKTEKLNASTCFPLCP